MPDQRGFPDGFLWGVATSSYQIEGAVHEDGRGASIWDTFAHTPGKVRHGHTGDIANDHYHRYRDDVALMKALGVRAYRFSIAWPRIFPEGTGQPNQKGIDFYHRLVDELLAAGIEPFPTLYHWDLPQALQDRGGWQSRETVDAFATYAGYVAEQLSDRVTNFFTINEFASFVDLGYRGVDVEVGGETVRIEHAPGLSLPPKELNQVRHHAVLAQGMAVQAMRAGGRAGIRLGPADNLAVAVPLIPTPEHIRAAEQATRQLNAGYLTVMLEGAYPPEYLESAGPDAPVFTDEELKTIATPIDLLGLNIYRPAIYVLASDDGPGYLDVPINASHPTMLSAWHLIGPEAQYWGVRQAHELWDVGEIYITESGCGASDQVSADGKVYDTDRVMYLRSHLATLQRATDEGLPLRGCFLWSLMDNFEWADGYDTRFGLVYVDFQSQQRIPKLSAEYYQEVIKANAVLP
jgi:beta-glucosidase